MSNNSPPSARPRVPNFSSGPTCKRPGWSCDGLKDAAVGRSHRAKIGKAKLQEVINRSRVVLGIPSDYLLGIVPASDTGAMEMALWSLLGARGQLPGSSRPRTTSGSPAARIPPVNAAITPRKYGLP